MKRLSFRAQLLIALCAYSGCPQIKAVGETVQQQTNRKVSNALRIALEQPENSEMHDMWMRVLYAEFEELTEEERYEFNERISQLGILEPEWMNGLTAASFEEIQWYNVEDKIQHAQFNQIFPQD